MPVRESPNLTVRRYLQLLLGLAACGFGVAGIIVSNLGAAPWDVLSQGISRNTGFSFGTVTIIIGVVVLLLWIPLRQRPGVGTVLNALLIGFVADFAIAVYPTSETLWGQAVMLTAGLVALGLGSGLYIGAGLGPGPRDGLMTGLHARTGRPIWAVRTVLELIVLSLGWLLGGTVGVGTLAVAFLIGPICQVFLKIFTIPRPVKAVAGLK